MAVFKKISPVFRPFRERGHRPRLDPVILTTSRFGEKSAEIRERALEGGFERQKLGPYVKFFPGVEREEQEEKPAHQGGSGAHRKARAKAYRMLRNF